MSTTDAETPDERPSFSRVLAIRQFRAMWSAELLSQMGDQLARVALSVLVFQDTGSAALTGLTYALTFVPALIGGFTLSGLGDSHPRRAVLVTTDVARGCLIALAAVPGLPLPVVAVLVAVMTLLAGPFKAAQQALLPDVLPGSSYAVGMALRSVTVQAAQLAGFAGGGYLASTITPSFGLAIDAATFLASAIVIRAGVAHHPASTPGRRRSSFRRSASAGAGVIWRDRRLRSLLALTLLAGLYIAPEALAVPYARAIDAGPSAAGLIMASDPLGSVIGGFVFGRLVPERWQVRHLGLLGCLAGAPLLICAIAPPVIVSVALLATGGMFATGYQIHASTTLIRGLPDEVRAQGAGIASTMLITVQGVGAFVVGVVADVTGSARAIALAGAVGIACAAVAGRAWNRADRAAAPAEQLLA